MLVSQIQALSAGGKYRGCVLDGASAIKIFVIWHIYPPPMKNQSPSEWMVLTEKHLSPVVISTVHQRLRQRTEETRIEKLAHLQVGCRWVTPLLHLNLPYLSLLRSRHFYCAGTKTNRKL